MKKQPGKNHLRYLALYAAFGVAITFAATILVFWIFQEIAQPIPMSLLIGLLVGMAFKLFSDAVAREQMKGK